MPPDPALLQAALAAAVAEAHGEEADAPRPGLSWAVTDRSGLVASGVAGFADLAARTPVAPGTLFEIGSIGKAFTAAVILQLADEGKLALDDPVVRHLPWFRVPRTGDRITIHHLLSHTAGITAGIDGTPEALMQVWRLRDLPPGSAPGRRFHYSNVGYKALGLLIEAVEGVRYPVSIRRRILEPLGITESEPEITHDTYARLAVGYEPLHDDRPWSPGDPLRPATWLQTDTADGSLAMPATDLAAFGRWLLTDDTGVVDRMATPVPALGAFGYGYGLFAIDLEGRRWNGHGGGMVGYIAGLMVDRAGGLGAAVLQSGYDGAPNALARLLVRRTEAWRDGRDPFSETMATGAGDPGEDGDDAGPPPVTQPTAEQAVVVGSYRSYTPWEPLIRVEARGGQLWLVFPSEPDGFELEQPLVPMARGWFRVGADRLGPERLRFDTVVDGRARRAWVSGWDFYRVGS